MNGYEDPGMEEIDNVVHTFGGIRICFISTVV